MDKVPVSSTPGVIHGGHTPKRITYIPSGWFNDDGSDIMISASESLPYPEIPARYDNQKSLNGKPADAIFPLKLSL